MKILIADPSSALCEALEEQLKQNHEVMCCSNGRDVFPLIAQHHPQLLILGLELPGIDGLTILQTMHSSGMQMRVLVMSSLINEYVANTLNRFDVSYAVEKPSSVCVILSRVYDLIHYGQQMPEDITSQLITLGFRMNLAGAKALCHAIRLMRENPDQSLTKELYPNVARICGTTQQGVERAIRSAIHDAWLHRDESLWRAYFSVTRQGVIKLPTNGDFITRMAVVGKDNVACG